MNKTQRRKRHEAEQAVYLGGMILILALFACEKQIADPTLSRDTHRSSSGSITQRTTGPGNPILSENEPQLVESIDANDPSEMESCSGGVGATKWKSIGSGKLGKIKLYVCDITPPYGYPTLGTEASSHAFQWNGTSWVPWVIHKVTVKAKADWSPVTVTSWKNLFDDEVANSNSYFAGLWRSYEFSAHWKERVQSTHEFWQTHAMHSDFNLPEGGGYFEERTHDVIEGAGE